MASLRNAEGIPISARTIVREGFTRRERLALAARNPRALSMLANFDQTMRGEILTLCDEFKRKHGNR